MSQQSLSQHTLEWAIQEIMSGNVNIQNISLFHSHSSSSSYQENENSLSINISTRGKNSQEFCQVFSTLAAQGSRCSLTNLAFYDVNWEQKPLHSFGSMLDNNSSIKDVEFHRNAFGTKAMLDLSDILGRNKRIRGIIFSACQLESIGARLIASALTKNDSLEELQIWEDSVGSTGAEELSKMIEINSTLKLLLIFDRQPITATPLLSAVLARNRNMEVHIWINDETEKNLKIAEFTPETSTLRIYKLNAAGSQRVVCALGLNTTVKILDMTGIQLKLKWAKEFRQVLEENRSLKEVKLSKTCLGDKEIVYIAAGLFKNKTIEKLMLDGNRFSGVGVEHLLCPLSVFSPFQNQANIALKCIAFGGWKTRVGREGVKAILRMLETNQTLAQLIICEDTSLKPTDVARIFKSLQKNATLRYLSLRGCKGVNGQLVLQTIMETLQINPWIEEIDLTGTPLQTEGKANGIYDKLGQNGSLVPESELLDDMPLTIPKCCRIFFCGQDFAGKSTLCNSIYHNLSSTKMPYMDQIRNLVSTVEQIARTAEIKIKSMHDGDTKISIWNLAGQHENFALHDLMFPGQGSPSFFFIVSSLFRKAANRESKSPEEIEDDLLYWLRFIVSNSRRALSQSLLPHITIVLTHSDKFSHSSEYLHQTLNLIQRLRDTFQGFVELYPTIFLVDARSSVSVSKLSHHLRKTSMTILQRAPLVYQICNEMIRLLSIWRSENNNKPAMKWNEFCALCQLKVPSLRVRTRRDNTEVEKRRQVVAKSLHQLGEVIFFQELGFLILDCMWFCGKVLSQLVNLDAGKVSTTIKTGFVSWIELEKILQSSVSVMGTKIFENLEASDLIKMMLKLELCYEQDPGNTKPLLFIPSILKEGHGRMPIWQLSTPECVYVGRHLECHDTTHMLLTTGFFPRLQVHLHNKILRNQLDVATYSLEKNLVSMIISGIHVRVEFGAQYGHYVDVLACSKKTITEILRLFSQLIMPTIQGLCPGITLSEHILRPDCVKYFIHPAFRRNQLVSLPTLKASLLSIPADNMYDYQHAWGPAYNGNTLLLPSGFDYARNLLSEEDFRSVLHRRCYDLQILANELAVPFENTQEPNTVITKDDENRVEPSLSGIAKGVEQVLQRLKIIEDEIKDLKQEIQGLRYYEHSLLTELHRKLDYLVNYNIQLEERKVPNMFYFVQVQNYSRRLVTRIISGMTALRLHMLCEYRREMHVVEDQLGCELLQVDNEAIRCLLPYMRKFMRLLTFALKIGAHFAAGMGEMIPDLGREVAHLLDSSLVYGTAMAAAGAIGTAAIRQFRGRKRNAELGRSYPGDLGQEIKVAQQWLVDFLKGQRISTGKDIAERFGLWRVRYFDTGHIAWVCQRHKELRSNEITELPI